MTEARSGSRSAVRFDEVMLVPGGSVDALLVANFTHQIVNPLNGVLGTIDNLIDNTITGARREQRLKVVRAQLSHIIELVRNLAYLSQLTTEAGRQGLRELGSRSEVPKVVLEAAMFFQELARDRGMEINLEDKRTPYMVKGPPDLLRQVFTNLFENAVKYGDRDREVWIRAHPQKKSGQLIVEVENIGPGFEPHEREAIFERGVRGQAAQGIWASGSGIGLFICREILDVGFGASIEAEHSRTHRKTTFRIRFPEYQLKTADEERIEKQGV
jgi:signal transduction histidine kinase